MSTETIVNRINSSAGLDKDLAEIETEETQASQVETSSETTVGTPAQEASHAVQFEQLEQDMIPVTQYSPESDLVSRALKAYAASKGEPSTASGLRLVPEFVEFRKQVIAAFKHMGLDTNKFFGV